MTPKTWRRVDHLTDGGEDVRDIPLYLNPQAEHLIDWFHITMRLTARVSQLVRGKATLKTSQRWSLSSALSHLRH